MLEELLLSQLRQSLCKGLDRRNKEKEKWRKELDNHIVVTSLQLFRRSYQNTPVQRIESIKIEIQWSEDLRVLPVEGLVLAWIIMLSLMINAEDKV